ncbi:hypothetical protein KSF73_16885 [Burkholderiaceae bacterium DAT-1]|nr:hypothetical protein [Burkholderiaceae bacterium DAT-1]
MPEAAQPTGDAANMQPICSQYAEDVQGICSKSAAKMQRKCKPMQLYAGFVHETGRKDAKMMQKSGNKKAEMGQETGNRPPQPQSLQDHRQTSVDLA